MFDKAIIISKLIDVLQSNGFETFVTQGSFDIIAKREDLILIKTLMNIDAFDESHAMDLRAISHFLSAYPFVVAVHNNRDHLNDETIYSRFELPVVTPKLFQKILEEDEFEVVHSSKGRHTQEINSFTLKEARKEMGYTLQELANQIGISKKAVYEIESRRVNPQKETVKKLEAILRTELTLPFEMKHTPPAYLKPKNNFQKSVSSEFSRLGIDNSSINSAPFEIIGKESFTIITNLSTTPSEVKHEMLHMKKLSELSESKAVVISKRTVRNSVEGVPIVSESELNETKTSKELGKIIDERK